MEWKDVTSYSRDDKDRIPSTWEYPNKYLSITIHRHIYYEKDQWLLSIKELGIDKKVLKNKELILARHEALKFINTRLISIQNSMSAWPLTK